MRVLNIDSPRMRVTQRGELIMSIGDYWSATGSRHLRISFQNKALQVTWADAGSNYQQVKSSELLHLCFRRQHHLDQFRRALLARIPASLARTAGACGHYLFPGVHLATLCPQAMELMQSAPLLYTLLIRTAVSRGWPRSDLEQAVAAKRTEIIRLIGGVGNKAQLKLLKKIPVARMTETKCWQLENALASKDCARYLAHWPVVSLDALDCVVRMMSGDELESMAAVIRPCCLDRNDFSILKKAYDDILSNGSELGVDARARLRRCRSIDQVEALRSELERCLREKEAPFFPAPPVDGTDEITPIVHPTYLYAEGREMHHCVGSASYCGSVQKGDCYVYRITSPERATVALLADSWHGWRRPQVLDIKGKGNKRVAAETLATVQKWLAAYCRSQH